MNSINTVKNDLRGEWQADLKDMRVENLKLSSNQAELANELQQQIYVQQRQIQTLIEELFKIKNILQEINCTEVKKCVAEDLTEIKSTLVDDDIKITQNEVAIRHVIIFFNCLIEAA